MQGVQVQSLVGELGSHMPLGPKTSKQKQYCNIFNKRLKNKTKNKWALEGDAGPSHASLESLPLLAKFRLKLKNVGKTTRPFRYEVK